jgi:peptidoglycan hydrolase-like protein with peptidoglycan-binding domain
VSGEAAPVPQAGDPAGSSGERSTLVPPAGSSAEHATPAPPAGRARRRVLAGAGLVLAAAVVVVVVTDPFAGATKPGNGVGDNTSATSLYTVARRSLSAQTQVSGTLGYAGSSSVRVPAGTSPSAVSQAAQSVTNAAGMLQIARASLAADGEALANQRATVAAARAKEAVDCAGENAAESAAAGDSSPSGEGTTPGGGSSPSGSSAGLCAGDVQAVATAEQGSTVAATKVKGDRAQVSSAEKALASAASSLSTARSAAALYGQSSTFTQLPAVGQVIARGQSLYAIGGQPVVLLYGSLLPTRAFIAGMPAGADVGELNANLEALGYGQGLAGDDTFSGATGAAIRTFQSAHGLTVTGELLLGSVVFEPGPVRVTSVTPTVGATVMPGPVLGISSTARQVKLALDAAQQANVETGNQVTITLPDNQTTPGRITYVSSVATAPSSKPGEEESSPTIEVDATPTDPAATGHLDQAPVNVSITTESVENALVVPVDALLALAGGGYAVEIAEGGVHHLTGVTLGLFDDGDGLVQVSGKGLSAGQRVVVPAT